MPSLFHFLGKPFSATCLRLFLFIFCCMILNIDCIIQHIDMLSPLSPAHHNYNMLSQKTPEAQRTLSYSQVVSTFSIEVHSIGLSLDAKTLYAVKIEDSPSNISTLYTIDVSEIASPKILATDNFTEDYDGCPPYVSPDGKSLYLVADSALLIFDISNQVIPTFQRSIKKSPGLSAMALSPKTPTAFIASNNSKRKKKIEIMDLSNTTTSSPILSSVSVDHLIEFMGIALSPNNDILYVTAKKALMAFNVADLTSPYTLYNYTIHPKKEEMLTFSISEDGQVVFLFLFEKTLKISLKILNVSNPDSYVVISTSSFKSNDAIPLPDCQSTFAPGNRYLFLTCNGLEYTLVTYAFDISDLQAPTVLRLGNYGMGISVFPNLLFADRETAFIIGLEGIQTIAFSTGVEFNSLYPMQSNVLSQFDMPGNFSTANVIMGLSADGDTAFIGTCDGDNYIATLAIINVTNRASSTLISFTDFSDYVCPEIGSLFMMVTPDESYLYLPYINLNITNLTAPTIMQLSDNVTDYVYQSIVSRPESGITVCLAYDELLIYNATNDPELVYGAAITDSSQYGVVMLSADSATVFVIIDREFIPYLVIYDISNTSSVKEIVAQRLLWDHSLYLYSATLSPDGKTILVIIAGHLEIIDVSDVTSPNSTGTLDLPTDFTQTEITFSVDGQIAFITSNGGALIRVDISVPESPRVLGYDPNVVAFALAPDGVTAYLVDKVNGFEIVTTDPKSILYMQSDTFQVGETTSYQMYPLELNNKYRYEFNNDSYKFGQFSLYDIDVIHYTVDESDDVKYSVLYPPLPSWASFNDETNMFTIQPNAEIGTYDLYTTLFSQVPQDAFTSIGMNTTTSLELMIFLTSMGYLDIQGFPTSNFDPNHPLILTSQYSDNDTAIRKVLSQHYIQVTTRVSVVQSLQIVTSDALAISTKSTGPVQVEIILQNSTQGVKVQFVDMIYSNSITTNLLNSGSTITMEGPLYAINPVLESLIINLNDGEVCDGMISISDGLNPPFVNYTITEISTYFHKNLPPVSNPPGSLSLQNQIDNIGIYTGSTFFIQFEQNSFHDPNGEDLTYGLSMADSGNPPPSWIQLKGLALYGTPPEDYYPFEYSFMIVATNQFLSTQQEFDIQIKISVLYGAKLAFTFIGGLATVIGLWVYASVFYNIIFKKSYRYPKDWELAGGEEIVSANLPTIAFISKELEASNFVVEKLQKSLAKEMNSKSISKAKLAEHFFNQETKQLDKLKLIKAIEETKEKLSDQEKEQLKQFSNAGRQIIVHLVENHMILGCLNINSEKVTKNVFNMIKKNWINLIAPDFKIDTKKVEQVIEAAGFNAKKVLTTENTRKSLIRKKIKDESLVVINKGHLESDTTSHMALVPSSVHPEPEHQTLRSMINMDLLEAALGAYVFSYHSLDIDPVDVDIMIKKKVTRRSRLQKLKEFFKLDLKTQAFFSKGKIGNGIKYKIENNFLSFYGTLRDDLEDEALVVQIKTGPRGRILREIWFNHAAPTGVPRRETNVEFVPMFRSLIK